MKTENTEPPAVDERFHQRLLAGIPAFLFLRLPVRPLLAVLGLLLGFTEARAETITHTVPIEIISFADDDGSRQAVSVSYAQQLLDYMNSRTYNAQGIQLVMGPFVVLKNTQANSQTGREGAEQFAIPYINTAHSRAPNTTAVFFLHDFTALAWRGWGGMSNLLDGSTVYAGNMCTVLVKGASESAYYMARGVSFTLGAGKLENYSNQALYGPTANPGNLMIGGTKMEAWQSKIIKDSRYVRPESAMLRDIGSIARPGSSSGSNVKAASLTGAAANYYPSLKWSITGGNRDDLFTIDSSSGMISVKDGASFQRSIVDAVDLEITATTANGLISMGKNNVLVYLTGLIQADIAFSDLTQPRTTTVGRWPTIRTTPYGLALKVTYNGSTTPPNQPGTYAVKAEITDIHFKGSGEATMVIPAQ